MGQGLAQNTVAIPFATFAGNNQHTTPPAPIASLQKFHHSQPRRHPWHAMQIKPGINRHFPAPQFFLTAAIQTGIDTLC